MVRRTHKASSRAQSQQPRAEVVASVTLDENLDLNAATRLRESLLAMRGADLAVDASNVEYLGAPCAQVLAAAVATWRAEGSAFSIKSASEPFRRGVQLLGLDSHFNPEGPSA